MNYEAEALRQQAQEQLDEVDALLARRAERLERAGGAEWQPVAPQPPRPVRRVPPQRQRAAAPASPPVGKVSVPVHDAAGRIASLQTFEADAAKSAACWQAWIKEHVEARVLAALDALGAEIGADVGQLERRIRDLEQRLLQAEERLPAPKPKLVDADAA